MSNPGRAFGAAFSSDGAPGAADYPPNTNISVTSDAGRGGMKSLTDLKKMLDDFRFTTSENSLQRLIDQDYYDGNQLTIDEVNTLKERGQPDIIVNRCRVAINGVLGVIARSPSDPKCWGRNTQDEESASVATDCLRYAAESTHFNRMKVECAKDFLVPGSTAILVGITDKLRIDPQQIRWEEFFWDPRSRRTDFKDSRYMGIAKWMFLDDVEALYPDDADGLENVTQGGSANIGATDERFEDRPHNQGWIDIRNRRILVIEIYYRTAEGWFKAVFYYGGVLEQGPSPYNDQDGKPCCPIIAVSAYVDRDNRRYGMMKDMRDLQDEINKRRSKLLHLVNSSQIQARDPSAIEVSPDEARLEAARPDGVIPYGWEKVPTNDMAQGQSLLLSEAKAEMERFGPNPAVLGRQGADTSGRALLARQQAGLVELAVLLDQLQDWELRYHEEVWARIKQFWTGPQVIRVTDDEQAPKFIMINEPIQPPAPPQQDPNAPPAPNPMMVDPATGSPAVPGALGYKNSIAEMDVDIIIDTTPATSTIMQEQFKDIMDLVSSNPIYSQQVPFTLFLELMPGVPRKRQLLAMLRQYKQEQQQQQAQQQQQDQARSDAMLNAKIEELLSKGKLNLAQADKAVGDKTSTAIRAHTAAAAAVVDAETAHQQSNIAHYKTRADAAATILEHDIAQQELDQPEPSGSE